MDDAVAAFFGGDDSALERLPKSNPVAAANSGMRVINGGRAATLAPQPAMREPTPFVWLDPATQPTRPWTYGNHLQRKTASATVAPGAVGKSSLVVVEALAMATGRALLDVTVPAPLKVWLINLEEPMDELNRRMAAAMLHHEINPSEIKGRFFLDGRDCELCMAKQVRGEIAINTPMRDGLIKHIKEHGIDHLTIDPFVKSHRVTENDNSAIDAVATEWARIADECNISIELVHHTRKGNGQELSSEDGRGGSSLLNAVRDGRVLNKASSKKKKEIGVDVVSDRATYFTVTQDKPNYSTGSGAEWHRTVGIELGNGDWVATVERYTPPDAFDGISVADTLAVQRAIDMLEDPRQSAQANNWVGKTVADVLNLDTDNDKRRIQQMLSAWQASGALIIEKRKDSGKGREYPCLIVGEWVNET
ncbi:MULTISPECIES: AAA family ATPase [Rhodobacterales]|uniref:AAA family ATPase n=1 Tax=Rhodobacterales TaxID=204455 RepID=UPI0037364E33